MTAAPPGLDRIAAAAAWAARAPMAAVTLVGARSVCLIGRVGLEAASLPRAGSFCGAVVHTERALLVDDAAHSADHGAHPLVRDDGVRSYAGVPVVDRAGCPIGTVCALAPERAWFGPGVLGDLSALAALVERLLPAERDAVPTRRAQGWLGIKTVRAQTRSSRQVGIMIVRVARQSPADRAGLRLADILYRIDGYTLRRPGDVAAALSGRDAAAPAELLLKRRGTWITALADVHPRSAEPNAFEQYWRVFNEYAVG